MDLAINEVLTLAGRDEARDFVDVKQAHEDVLPLGAIVWTEIGKEPGFAPMSLLKQVKRCGRGPVPHFGQPAGLTPHAEQTTLADARILVLRM